MWRKQKSVPEKKAAIKAVSPQRAMIKRQVIIGLLLTVFCVALVSFVGYVTRLPSLQIKGVEVVGGITIPHSLIEEEVQTELSGMYLKLIPKTFRWLYPKVAIERRVSQIDRVKHVHIDVNNEEQLVIAFEEYVPIGLWCRDTETTECLFIDTSGFAFSAAPDLTGNAFVRFVTEEEPAVGGQVASQEYVSESRQFVTALESDLSLFVSHIIKVGEIDTEYQIAGGGSIKVSQSLSAAETLANLEAVLQSDDFSHLLPGMFNYIDLRFGDKVFVNEVKESETESATTTEVEDGA